MSILKQSTDGADASCCADFAAVSRRGFLGGALALAGTTSVFGSAVLTAGPASATTGGEVLVVLSLRGAADGLSLVVPHNDPVYYSARPTIAIPRDRLLRADAMFGLHPALAPLDGLWASGRMATVQAAGQPVVNRSHFAAMEELEDADPGSATRVGWLNRLVGTTAGAGPLQGFAVGGGTVPTSLAGPEAIMSAGSVDRIKFAGEDVNDPARARMTSLHRVWDGHQGPLGPPMRAAFGALSDFAPVRQTTETRSRFPTGSLGTALSTASRIIRGDVGVQVLTVDHGQWDMHTTIGTSSSGKMQQNADELARGIAAFFADLGPAADRVTLVTISEFGRRVKENANKGLDHGYGNVMMVFGSAVRGGYHGRWPGLVNSDDADLLVTTDYRDVLADVVESRFNASIPTVFPGFQRRQTGVMTSVPAA